MYGDISVFFTVDGGDDYSFCLFTRNLILNFNILNNFPFELWKE